MKKEEKVGLLPDTLYPQAYDIHLTPDLEGSAFAGKMEVSLRVAKSTEEIVFNALEVEVEDLQVRVDGESVEAGEMTYDKQKQQVTVPIARVAPEQQVSLSMTFRGQIRDDMIGFYKSFYKTEEGETRFIYSTHFESTDARRAFPCWDEPVFKAKFRLAITAPSALVVLSNMDEEGVEKKEGGLQTVQFKETPAMSTYLLAYVVGDLGYVEAESRGRPIRVYSIRGTESNGEYGLAVAKHCLEFFEEYFDYAYPLPKMDMVAIPEFSAGAMENWGLVTYRSIALLYDAKNSSIRIKANIAATICHELAHQWFGNLVTMKWWNDLWLNEGFATWAGTLAVDSIKEQIGLSYDVWGEFVFEDIERGREMDGKLATHPIDVKVTDGGEISSIFGAIVYSKGASLIHMLANHLGIDGFRNGLRRYIKEHAYQNTTTSDLWAAIEEETGNREVGKMMDNWTRHPGFPVVEVTSGADSEDDEENPKRGKRGVAVSQRRYLPNGDVAEEQVVWHIPLSYREYLEDGEREERVLFSGKEMSTEVSPASSFLFNLNGAGFYRVKYTEEMYAKIFALYRSGRLSALDRLGLTMDLAKLVGDRHLDVEFFLGALDLFKGETDYNVMTSVVGLLGGIRHTYNDSEEIRAKVDQTVVDLLEGRGDVDLEGTESDIDKRQMDMLVVGQLVKREDTRLQKLVMERFGAGEEEVLKIHPDFKGAVFQSIARFGGEKGYEFLLSLAKGPSEDEALRALLAIGFVSESALFDNVFALFRSDDGVVKKQDKMRVMYAMSANGKFKEKTYYKFKESFEEILEVFKDNDSHVRSFIEKCGGSQSKWEVLADMEAFFAKYRGNSGLVMGIDKALSNARNNCAFYEKNKMPLARWASNRGDAAVAMLPADDQAISL